MRRYPIAMNIEPRGTMSKATLYGYLLLASLAYSGCRETCTAGEIRYGDKCVLRPDAGTMRGTSGSRASDASDGVDGTDELIDEPADDGTGNDADDAGAVDAPSEDSDGSTASGNTSNPCASDGGTPSECKPNPCNPNPCGHGQCASAGEGFRCSCEAGWIGEGICNTNTNATLHAIMLSEGTLYPAFDPATHDYSVDVGIETPEITLNPIAVIPDGVDVSVDGKPLAADAGSAQSLELNVPRRVKIDVVADSGKATTYTVTMRRTLALHAEIVNPRPGATAFGGIGQDSSHHGKGIALNGNLLAAAIAGPEDGEGTVALYNRAADGTWTFLDSVGSPVERRGLYGAAIALTTTWLAIGAPGISPGSPEKPSVAGGVYLFQRSLLPNRAEQIYLPPPSGSEEFGHTLALQDETLAVLSDHRLHVFELRNSTWTAVGQFDVRGYSIAMTGDRIAVSERETVVHTYRRVGDAWREDGYIGDSAGGALGGVLTSSENGFAITSLYACLTSCIGMEPLLRSYEPLADGWSAASIGPPFGPAVPRALDPNGFGADLGWSGRLAVVGAPGEASQRGGIHVQPGTLEGINLQAGGWGLGVAYFFVRASRGWRLDALAGPTIHADGTQQVLAFGTSVAVDHGLIAVSAPMNIALLAGTIYIFGPDCTGVPHRPSVPGC
jgi:Cadherin-like beta sandwich domain